VSRGLLSLRCLIAHTIPTLHRDDFKHLDSSKFRSASDVYTDREHLCSLLQTQAPVNGLKWHILPPTPRLTRKHRQTYYIISWKQLKCEGDFLGVSIDELVSLFPCTDNFRMDYPKWIQSACSIKKVESATHPKDLPYKFYQAMKSSRRKRLDTQKKESTNPSVKISGGCTVSVC
jgi:hypothetical protein